MFNLSTILYCFMVYKLSHLWDTKRLINNKPNVKPSHLWDIKKNMMKFDRNIYNIILVHVARTWERLRLNQPHQEMPLDNIESPEELQIIADFVIETDLVQEFLTNRDGSIWDKFGDGCSDVYIERVGAEYINENYL
jgi:hypothetical protein